MLEGPWGPVGGSILVWKNEDRMRKRSRRGREREGEGENEKEKGR